MPASTQYYLDKELKYTLPENISWLNNVSPANADVAILRDGQTNARHVIAYGIAWSYSAGQNGVTGRLLIREGFASTCFDIDITTSGPGFIPFYRRFGKNSRFEVYLFAGGAGVIGKINVLGSYAERA